MTSLIDRAQAALARRHDDDRREHEERVKKYVDERLADAQAKAPCILEVPGASKNNPDPDALAAITYRTESRPIGDSQGMPHVTVYVEADGLVFEFESAEHSRGRSAQLHLLVPCPVNPDHGLATKGSPIGMPHMRGLGPESGLVDLGRALASDEVRCPRCQDERDGIRDDD